MTLFTTWLVSHGWLDTTPTPIPEFTGDADAVTPGVLGFVAIFLIAAATVLLILDMMRRVRRVRYRSEIRERLETEAKGDPAATERTPGD